jgi:hypothetical protein
MKLTSPLGDIEILNESCYAFGSEANPRHYELETNLSPGQEPTSIHGVLYNGAPWVVCADCGSTSGVHAYSAVLVRDALYLAVGAHVACLDLATRRFKWGLQVDYGACFGVHYHAGHKALLSHGELAIARFSPRGELLWSFSGSNVFSGNIELEPDCIAVTDFKGLRHRIDYATGESLFRSLPL